MLTLTSPFEKSLINPRSIRFDSVPDRPVLPPWDRDQIPEGLLIRDIRFSKNTNVLYVIVEVADYEKYKEINHRLPESKIPNYEVFLYETTVAQSLTGSVLTPSDTTGSDETRSVTTNPAANGFENTGLEDINFKTLDFQRRTRFPVDPKVS